MCLFVDILLHDPNVCILSCGGKTKKHQLGCFYCYA